MRMRLLIVAVLAAVTALAFAGMASAGLNVTYVFNGHGGYSTDGLGQNGGGGSLQAEIPAGSTVTKAFLHGTYYFDLNPDLGQRTIDFDGNTVVLTKISDLNTCCALSTASADVTGIVAAKVGGPSVGGIFNFVVGNDPSSLDGLALTVVYSNPALPLSTVAVLDGSSTQSGDTTTFNFSSPLDKTVPGFTATMSLGSGFSYQGVGGHVCGPVPQYSIVDVNGQRLTTCAGSYDDGLGNNGALITVGGVGDSIDNPLIPTACCQGTDDELYNIEPFLHQGDTSTVLNTSNPSGDDNLFLAVIAISATASVCGPNNPDCPPPPPVEQQITASGSSISATEGASFSGTVATFTDPDTAATASEYSATINWGDGSPTSSGTISGGGGSFTVSGTHTYAEEGTYTTTIVVTDTDTASNTATATGSAKVADAALTAKCGDAVVTNPFAGVVQRFTDADPAGTVTDYGSTINWGDSTTSTGVVSPDGSGFKVSGAHVYASSGYYTITVTTADVGGSTAVSTCKTLVAQFAPGGGSFVIGDGNSAVGTAVTFWGAQWWKLNTLSGGAAPASFKGFATNPAAPACNIDWSTDPGNSAPPPAGPLPAYMAVIVTSSSSKSGSQISGNTPHIVVVQTDAGYDSNPGHAGTGTVVAQLC